MIGAFVLYSATADAFDEDARNLLLEMSRDISFGLDNLDREVQRRQTAVEIEHLAYFDPLTGLPNRRLLRERLRQRQANKVLRNRHAPF